MESDYEYHWFKNLSVMLKRKYSKEFSNAAFTTTFYNNLIALWQKIFFN